MIGSAEFKVGAFVLACLGIIAAMALQVNNDPSVGGRAHHYNAILKDASGLVKNSNVKMAGIPVGIIKEIILDNGEAKVVMSIRGNLHVSKDASIIIKPNGILGDKYLEINPGDPNGEVLPDNASITNVTDRGSMDAILGQVSKIASDIGEITKSIKSATTGEGDDSSPVGRILHNIEDLTADLKDISADNKEKVNDTLTKIHNIATNIDNFVGDESEDGFKTNWKKMAKSLGRVDSILKNVDEITGKVNQGKGTIGRLVNDETTIEEINHAVAGVNNFIDTASKFQITVDYHSELQSGSFTKSYIGINIQPGPDRYYLLQVVDDPRGSFERVEANQLTNGQTTPTTTSSTLYHNKLKFSAQFAKNFYDLTLRAGIIESAGGIGVDYYFFNKKLRFTTEAFNFSRQEGVDVRAYARYKFYSVFYAVVGGDDIFNPGSNQFSGTKASGFIGAGLDFTNDDLKLLLTKVPM
jgi:phospholipid/cholesterol/gamma-HCH transport system substrate-binding protein